MKVLGVFGSVCQMRKWKSEDIRVCPLQYVVSKDQTQVDILGTVSAPLSLKLSCQPLKDLFLVTSLLFFNYICTCGMCA